jgi:hypothetical protein
MTRNFLICLGLGLGSAIALGFGGIAYALIVPAMRENLAWIFAESNSLNSANALGHSIGALLAIRLINHFAAARAAAPLMLGSAVCLFQKDVG